MVTSKSAPASYRGSQSPEDFIARMGDVWIGLIEKIASDPDQNGALAAYFDVAPKVIDDWIEARGRTRCSAFAPGGRRCANLVGLKVEYDPRVWANERLRCTAHGPG